MANQTLPTLFASFSKIAAGLIATSALMTACTPKDQTTYRGDKPGAQHLEANEIHPAQNGAESKKSAAFPSVGSNETEKTKGDFQSVGGQGATGTTSDSSTAISATGTGPAKANAGAPTIPPMNSNGIVGSPMAGNINSANMNSAPSSEIDVAQYSYAKRDQFKSLMEARLTAVDRGVTGLRGSKTKTVSDQNIDQLKTKEDQLKGRLAQMGAVDQSSWDQFKTSLRDEVVSLERSVQEVSTAKR